MPWTTPGWGLLGFTWNNRGWYSAMPPLRKGSPPRVLSKIWPVDFSFPTYSTRTQSPCFTSGDPSRPSSIVEKDTSSDLARPAAAADASGIPTRAPRSAARRLAAWALPSLAAWVRVGSLAMRPGTEGWRHVGRALAVARARGMPAPAAERPRGSDKRRTTSRA
eukprot:CAMPEP_0170169528 /NCGR_PEP_ID=MMETSP0040_2-20121228/2444_1 /TAXON_ID=641309 /ORGANISM="Lotharella oceanica, Strain CCMP622" /LENGTH=163 /DNA_ID=CAMNT_0010408325 /DNA_START=286 /DNA_END=773 /DNA_ORIENTATION=-